MAGPSSVLLGVPFEPKMRERLTLRVATLSGLAAVCLLFPAVGENRFWLALALLGLTPIPMVLAGTVPAKHWMLASSIFDIVATVMLIGFVPDVWASGLLIVAASTAAAAAVLGRRKYVVLEVCGLAAMGVAAWVSGAQDWQIPLAAAVVMIPVVVSYIDVFITYELSASAHLDDVANASSAVFWEVDERTGAFIGVRGRVEEVFGHRPEDLPAELPSILAEDDRQRWWEQVLENDDEQFVLECRTIGTPERARWLRLHGRRVVISGQRVLRGIAIDVTELATTHEEIKRRAETDHLTGLANRFVLVKGLNERLAVGTDLALFVLDLDRFKDVNDTLGHLAGDEYLQIMAARLKEQVDQDGIVARMGGDEFAVIADASAGLSAVSDLARALVECCETPVEIAGVDLAGSASCGLAIAPIHGTTAEDLLRRADLAMYAAKRSGVGVHLFEFSADESNINRLQLSGEAEAALAAGHLRLWYQPKIELATGHVIGAEALLRWHHPDRGVLMPADFLDMVELSRHRKALCNTVITQGVAFLAEARRDSGRPLSLAVNVSMRDLIDPDFAVLVTSLLEENDLPPSDLTLEITERDLMDDRTAFLDAATVVRAIGVQLSIDDFGTGHSSLLRLHQLPVSELKIDRSFVAGIGDDREAEIIVKSILELGRSLGHQVVAEGIERMSEVALLRSLGCQVGQGYLYSAALPPDEFMVMLNGKRVPAPVAAADPAV